MSCPNCGEHIDIPVTFAFGGRALAALQGMGRTSGFANPLPAHTFDIGNAPIPVGMSEDDFTTYHGKPPTEEELGD